MSSNSKVQEILAARNKRVVQTRTKISEETKLKWKEQEITDGQVEKLRNACVPDQQIFMLNKYDASELIEKIMAARELDPTSVSATLGQKQALEIHYGFTKDEVADLNYAQATEIFTTLKAQFEANKKK